MDDIIKAIDELPSNGEWWREDNRDQFVGTAEFLVSQGLKTADIIDILQKLYSATADEFGE